MESAVSSPDQLKTGGEERTPSILSYHQFHEDGQTSLDYTSLLTSEFEKQLHSLRDHGWQFVPLAELVGLVCHSERTPAEPMIAITFDDAYRDILKVAPLLASFDVPSTVFLLTDYIGEDNLWNPKSHVIKRHLSHDEILGLGNDGVDFQFHGVHHHRLTKFSLQELEDLFLRGQAAFGELFEREASMVAYPYGAFNGHVLEAAANHFQYGFSVSQGKWSGSESRYQLNRIEVTTDMTAPFLVDLVSCEPTKRCELTFENRATSRARSGDG